MMAGGLPGPTTTFQSLLIADWRQIQHVEIEFHPRLTVLTGANGSGKTTILNLLGHHLGWYLGFVGVAGLLESLADELSEKDGSSEDEILRDLRKLLSERQVPAHTPPGWHQRPIGRLTYENGTDAVIVFQEPPASIGAQESIAMFGQQPVQGLNLPAHRSVGGYQNVQAIPASFNPAEQILTSFINELRNRYTGTVSQPGRTPLYWMKEALIAAAIYGEGNQSVTPNPEAREVFDGFQDILRLLLPTSIGFRRLYIRSPEVVVSTSTGDFPIDAVSGGVSAVMELAWQIFLRSRNADRFVVCIDEPENHLHPELQRVLLPNLVAAFPKVQFIAATHSPFIVGSVPDSSVYALRFDERGRVNSTGLDLKDKAGTASEVLLDVLGMETTLPKWAESRLDAIVDKYRRVPLTSESIAAMRRELNEIGLGEVIPDAISNVFRRSDQPDDQAN